MSNTIIDKFYEENVSLIQFLGDKNEPSFQTNADDQFKKVLVLSIASYFEHTISDILLSYVKHYTNNNERLIFFMKKKGIDRQYHTFFKWDGNNANQFFSLFGDSFKKDAERASKENPILKTAISAFLTLGNMRNEMVHENFASFYLDKTFEEVYRMYNLALPFLAFVKEQFKILDVFIEKKEQIAEDLIMLQSSE